MPVSRRLSTVAGCDCIYVLEHGRIVEYGTHDQLLARDGAYSRMARHQLLAETNEPSTTASRE